MSGNIVTYYSVKPFEIIQNYLDFPDEYNKEGLLEKDKIRFGIDSDGRVICPISFENLTKDSLCNKVDCCKRVFLQTSLKDWILKKSSCPCCIKPLKNEDVLTIRERVKSYFNRVSSDFSSTFESEESLEGSFLHIIIINLYT